MHKNRNYKSAFTLVELTIVLVIIAVLLGFVTVGRDLLRSAETSALIGDITYYSTARKQFEASYGYLPGDVANRYLLDAQPFGDGANHASSLCGILTTGNGKWDNITEADLAWIQLSYVRMIDQNIDFDQCAAGTVRVPGTHRPLSKGSKIAGATFLETVAVTAPDANTYRFIKVLRIGKNINETDLVLSEGTIPVKALREIDRKIDKPETPFSGRFFTDAACGLADLTYQEDSVRTLCTANFADFDAGRNSWVP